MIFRFAPIPDVKVEGLQDIDAKKSLEDWDSSKKLLIIVASVVALYILHSYLGIEAGLVAMFGAATALVWIRPDIQQTLESIEWDAIVFLAGLFVVVGGLEAVGILHNVAQTLGGVLKNNPLVAPIGLLWIAGTLSSVIDNIPFTVAMVPILLSLEGNGAPGALSNHYLWWALAMGAAMGGAATPVGSSANVVAMSVSERAAETINSRDWVKVGIPVAIMNLTIGTLFLITMIWIGY